MRSDAKASTAGSTRRQGKKPALLLCVLAAAVAALALVVGSASAAKVHSFKEVFGSAAQPSFSSARSVAVDQSTGNVLVMDSGASTISRYNPDGTPDNFSALGTNVIDGQGSGDATPQGGLSFSSASESQIAIDDSGTATDGNIYVTQGFPNLINIFSSTGAYLGQLTAAGVTDFSEACGVAVDPAGAVYVGDYSSGIKKFVPAANPPVNADHTATFSSVSTPCTLAAGAGATAGFLFPAQYSGPISKIDSGTGELKYTVSSDSHTTVTVDPATGHVFGATGSSVKEFDASGAGSATSVAKVVPASSVLGVAVDDGSGDIYASRSESVNVEVFDSALVTYPDPATATATANTGTKATLNGTVNPDGLELDECFFEWGETTAYGQIAPCVESPPAIGAGTSPVAVHADLSGLQPNGTGYNFRLVAVNENAQVNGEDLSFTTPDTVITTAASAITPTGATLNGTVKPDGVSMTECFFEWGETTAYGETAPCVPNAAGIGSGTSPVAVSANLSGLEVGTVYHYRLKAANANGPISGDDLSLQTTGPVIGGTWAEDVVRTEAILKAEINPEGTATTFHFEYGITTAYGSETPDLAVGSDSSLHEVSGFLDDLEPGTTYHYRVVATNTVAVNEGLDRVIRTHRVSMPDADCANQVFRIGASAGLPDCRAYEMVSPIEKNNGDIIVLSETLTSRPSVLNQSSVSGDRIAYGSYRAFGDAESAPYTSQYIAARGEEGWSSHGITPPRTKPILAPPAMVDTEFKAFSADLCQAWLRTFSEPPLAADAVGKYINFYRRQDDECGGEEYEALTTVEPVLPPTLYNLALQGLSADGSHVLYAANDKLTPDVSSVFTNPRLYEMTGGQLRFVCILPNGEASPQACAAGNPADAFRRDRYAHVDNAISADGSRIFWTTASGTGGGSIYVRINGTETVAVSQEAGEETGINESTYWTAAEDGSKAVFTTQVPSGSHPNLYEFDVDSETTHLIAGEVPGVLGASEDASRIYFVSSEALDADAAQGEYNLYLYESTADEYTFIATISDNDINSFENLPILALQAWLRTPRVTPDGLHVAFISDASLTGFDNADADNGKAQGEVYLYDATANGETGELVCASCNPSGERPEGRSTLPVFQNVLYAARVLADDGSRLYFESADSLTPRDTNGRIDVYQWEEEGAGGCDEGDPGFAPSAAGCVELISSGQSLKDSEFVDASPSGDDVFIATLSSLLPQDYGLVDIYDARVGGGLPLPPSPPDCVGDACQSIPSAPNDPTPASASFRGAGDPKPQPDCTVTTKRAAKLNRQAKRARRRGQSQRAARLADQAKRLSRSAARCRRANRRAAR